MSLHNSTFCVFLEFTVLYLFLFFFCSFNTRICRFSYVIARNSNLHFSISKDTSIIFYYVDLLLEIICSPFFTVALDVSVVAAFKWSLV